MKQRKQMCLLAPMWVFLAAGCASEDVRRDELPDVQGASAIGVVPVTEEDGVEVVTVTMREMAFAPARVEITAGTTVVWRNAGEVAHTATARDGSWDSGLVQPGATWQRRFDAPGTYAYVCTPHPQMTGTIVVRAED